MHLTVVYTHRLSCKCIECVVCAMTVLHVPCSLESGGSENGGPPTPCRARLRAQLRFLLHEHHAIDCLIYAVTVLYVHLTVLYMHRLAYKCTSGRGTARAEDAHGTPTQSHMYTSDSNGGPVASLPSAYKTGTCTCKTVTAHIRQSMPCCRLSYLCI